MSTIGAASMFTCISWMILASSSLLEKWGKYTPELKVWVERYTVEYGSCWVVNTRGVPIISLADKLPTNKVIFTTLLMDTSHSVSTYCTCTIYYLMHANRNAAIEDLLNEF